MKLRNKKTGEIIDLEIANIKAQFGGISVIPEPAKLGGDEYVYHSLAELNSEWEDYKPKEPLIKDEKVRKAVRAWAEANDMKPDVIVRCGKFDDGFETRDNSIEFDCSSYDVLRGVERGRDYTIDELCGEEEK